MFLISNYVKIVVKSMINEHMSFSDRSIANNSLNGSVPSTIWQDRVLNGSEMLRL